MILHSMWLVEQPLLELCGLCTEPLLWQGGGQIGGGGEWVGHWPGHVACLSLYQQPAGLGQQDGVHCSCMASSTSWPHSR